MDWLSDVVTLSQPRRTLPNGPVPLASRLAGFTCSTYTMRGEGGGLATWLGLGLGLGLG